MMWMGVLSPVLVSCMTEKSRAVEAAMQWRTGCDFESFRGEPRCATP